MNIAWILMVVVIGLFLVNIMAAKDYLHDTLLGEARHDNFLCRRVYRSVSGALDFGDGVRSHNAGQFRLPFA